MHQFLLAMCLKEFGSETRVTLYMTLHPALSQNVVLTSLQMAVKTKVIRNGGGSPKIVRFRGLMLVDYWRNFVGKGWSLLENKRSVYEINGNEITKRISFLGVRFSSYNIIIDFYRSVFLVKNGPVPRNAPKRVKTALRLDKMDDISHEWIGSDVLIFNSGHWSTRTKLFDAKTCKVTSRPWKRTNGRDRSPISDMIMRTVKEMKAAVRVLHVTPMGAYRSDGHVGRGSDNPSVPDCSHWCLPGVLICGTRFSALICCQSMGQVDMSDFCEYW